ncbi:Nramp family divalent metal transporter [Coprothermobacteraceae bacterium]|nr:Nramp family divalent metal transporter [Coprothermobacteraceae bacterium]
MLKSLSTRHSARLYAAEIIKYIGPGFLVTVGFIDPGNWASNMVAGSTFGYRLLWVVSLSTIMLIVIQHNAAHLGIATGLCLAEAATLYFPRWASRLLLWSAIGASISTLLAEILGAAIGLNMLVGLPTKWGALLGAVFATYLLLSNSYRRTERWIIGFVGLIGLSFLFELALVRVDWAQAAVSWVRPNVPYGSMLVVMSVLGAVVMPHNIFLHSEVIQSRQWNTKDESTIRKQLNYEFVDTLVSMIVGWAINSAMILVAASVFFASGIEVSDLAMAKAALEPMLGSLASGVFATALILSGLSSSITAAMASGSVFAGMYGEPFDIRDPHSRAGVYIGVFCALAVVLLLRNELWALVISQAVLSVQLPWTLLALILLTSKQKVMGKFANSLLENVVLWLMWATVSFLNVKLLFSLITG